MALKPGDKLMSLTEVSEMLGIPLHTLYRWRYKGDGPVGYRVGRHVRYRREAVEAWLEQQVDQRWQLRRKNQSPSGPPGVEPSAEPVQAPRLRPSLSRRDFPTVRRPCSTSVDG